MSLFRDIKVPRVYYEFDGVWFLVLFSGRFRELLKVDAALNLKTRRVLCYFVIFSVDVELT